VAWCQCGLSVAWRNRLLKLDACRRPFLLAGCKHLWFARTNVYKEHQNSKYICLSTEALTFELKDECGLHQYCQSAFQKYNRQKIDWQTLERRQNSARWIGHFRHLPDQMCGQRRDVIRIV